MSDEKYRLRPEPPTEPEKLDAMRPRVSMPRRRPEDRITGFDEFEMGFAEQDAQNEASRCLRCDLEHIKDMQEKEW